MKANAPLSRPKSASSRRPMDCRIVALRTVTGLSAMICERARSPLLSLGSIAMRKSGASTRSGVSWQITTEALVSGKASVWTMTAGRGFPSSPAAATITRSPRLIVRATIGRIELGNGLDRAHRLILTAWDETSDLRGHTPTDRGQARIGDDNSQFAQAALAPSLPHLSHPF